MVWGCSVGCGNFSGPFSKEEAFMHSRETGHGVWEDNGTVAYSQTKINTGWRCSFRCYIQPVDQFDPSGELALKAHALQTGHSLMRDRPYAYWSPPPKPAEVVAAPAPKPEPKPEKSIRLPEAEPEL